MRRLSGFFSALFLLLPLAVQAQTPEMEKAQVWIGDWTYEHTNGHGTMSFERFGDNLVLAKEEYTTNSGTTTPMFHIIGYDADDGVYWWRRFTRSPEGSFFTGTVDGNTWTFVAEGSQRRMVQVVESEDLIHFRWETPNESGDWEVTTPGTMHRVR